MAKEFVKGVTVGEATAEENTQPAVSTVETNEEETKQVIRANEEDFIAGLIAAADFASDEEETQRIEIVRNGKLAFAFYIRPLGSEEYDKCRKKFTKYVRNKQLGIKMPEDTDRIKYQSAIIHKATIAEDREKGDFYCYEVKSSVEDFHSKNGHNFLGDYNYYVMPEEVYEQIKKEIPYQVGVYVPDGMNYRGEWYDLKAIKKAKRKDRSRPVSEMLLMMFRSAARDRKKVLSDGH